MGSGVGGVRYLQEIVEDINSYFHRLLNHPKVKEEVAAVSVSVAAMAAAIASIVVSSSWGYMELYQGQLAA